MIETARQLATMPEADRLAVLGTFTAPELEALQYEWPLWARIDQLPPPGDWRTWLLLGGRGSGKTRSAAEWVRAEVESGRRGRLALIGPTAEAIRRDMVEGVSGILAVAPPWCRPNHEPSTRRLVWPNGAIAHLFSAEEPDRLRGPNLDGYWADELAAWQAPEGLWSNLQMALRLPGPRGDAPRGVVSTTPRPIPLLRSIMKAPSTALTRSRTKDNSANLDPATLEYLDARYGGTTLGRQELDAELLEDLEGALWTRGMIEASRVAKEPDEFRRIVVAIDPAGGASKTNDETGIIAAGATSDRHVYILRDASGRFSPDGWARRAVDLFQSLRANGIVCESNFGGEMVRATIRSVAPYLPVKMVHASRGKQVRAEPVVALYEQRRVHHVGAFPELEDQLCQWDPMHSTSSPDRLDALVWAITELALTAPPAKVWPLHM
jgi:phage terminase large subunit-like protein